MKRQFAYQTLTAGGTPQPVFGTTLTAAVGPKGSRANNLQSIAVTSSAIFLNKGGDWIILDPLGANPERLNVLGVPDSTHIQVQGVEFTHNNGVFVQLADSVFSVYIQCQPGNTGDIYIGGQGMVKATGPFYALLILTSASAVQPIEFNDYVGDGMNVLDTADYWFDGTTGDKILPSFSTR